MRPVAPRGRLRFAWTPLLILGSALPALSAPAPRAGKSAGTRTALLWPLQHQGATLSSFGEYRYDHLHAGIDISTGGGTGYKVLAAADGEVFRLKVEWRGYGRALYLRHAGGRVTGYGHLERYEDRVLSLERLVSRRQAAGSTRYPGDIYPDRPIPVRRGQVIAYSGESGVGLPHLHFEVRDAGDAPIDPFEAGLPRPVDGRPPVLESITVTAASSSTFIEGVDRERVYALKPGASGLLTTDRPVRVSGPFLLTLSAYDAAGESGRAGIRSIETKIDGVSTYRFGLRSFRFDQYPQAGLLFDHRLSRLGPASFGYRLFRLPGNDLAEGPEGAPISKPDVYPGAVDLKPGSHILEVTVGDAAANRSRARLCLQVGRAREVLQPEWGGPGHAPGMIRFRLEADGPAAESSKPGGSPAGCPRPGQDVEAAVWDDSARVFREIPCRLEDGTCAVPESLVKNGPAIARVREVDGGVPGPWRLMSRDHAQIPEPESVSARIDCWPAFLDISMPMPTPLSPVMHVAAGLQKTRVADLTYDDGSVFSSGIGYTRASGLAPFFVVAEAEASPLASLSLDVLWAEPGKGLDYHGPGFSLRVPEKGRFFPGPLVLRTETTPGGERLPAIADAVEILPEGEVLNDRGTLCFDLSPGAVDPATLGIYRWDGKQKRWGYEGGDLEEEGRSLCSRFRRYGRFALLQDAAPPSLEDVRPPQGARPASGRVSISARVEEEGKGLNYDGVIFELDGRRLESEFDPDRSIARVLDPPTLTPGKHRLVVTAVDLAGNRSAPIEEEIQVGPLRKPGP